MASSTWIDISIYTGPGITPLYPGTPPIIFEKLLSLDAGCHADDTYLKFGIHSGTHIDMPSHFIKGAASIDDLDLGAMIGPCHVLDLRGKKIITGELLESLNLSASTERLLLKTDNSEKILNPTFDSNFVGLDESASEYLSKFKNLKLVGIDYLSIQAYRASHQVHINLLQQNIVVLDGLNLTIPNAGQYELFCLPIKLKGTEGAPARALLRPLC